MGDCVAKSEDKRSGAGMIRHGRFRKTAPGARFRGKQHLGAGGDHDSGPIGPPRRGLRSHALVPGEVLAVCPQISSLPGVAGRSRGLFDVRRATAGRAVNSMCCCRRMNRDFCLPAPGSASKAAPGWRCRPLQAIASRTARRVQPAARSLGAATAGDADRDVRKQLRGAIRFPAVVKTSVGTASRGIWFVRNDGDLDGALQDLGGGAFADEVLVQDLVAGTTEKAQSVFCRGEDGRLSCLSAVMPGVGGGEAIKQSVDGRSFARPRKGRTVARLARCTIGRLHHAG